MDEYDRSLVIDLMTCRKKRKENNVNIIIPEHGCYSGKLHYKSCNEYEIPKDSTCIHVLFLDYTCVICLIR